MSRSGLVRLDSDTKAALERFRNKNARRINRWRKAAVDSPVSISWAVRYLLART